MYSSNENMRMGHIVDVLDSERAGDVDGGEEERKGESTSKAIIHEIECCT